MRPFFDSINSFIVWYGFFYHRPKVFPLISSSGLIFSSGSVSSHLPWDSFRRERTFKAKAGLLKI